MPKVSFRMASASRESVFGVQTSTARKIIGGNPTCAALVAQQEAFGSVNYPDAEVEPYIAVDPTNPQHLIGSVQQDRWNDGGANGLTNVVSTDGGATRSPRSPGSRLRMAVPWTSAAPHLPRRRCGPG
jgi:hypothetical protein